MSDEIPVPEEIARAEIIRSLVGSTLYGTGNPAQEDTDYMGVCIEPWESVLGLGHFEQWIWRTQPEGVRSGKGDIDITIYGLGKFLRLATKGNPSILILLFSKTLPVCAEWGRWLQTLAPSIVSQKVAAPYIGYCQSQRERLEDVRGGRHVNRPELVEAHGYDTKYAMHALRLAYQGEEILTTGRIQLPIPEPEGSILRAIRMGEVPYDDYMKMLDEGQTRLKTAASVSKLPDGPDMDVVNMLARDARLHHWNNVEWQ